LAVASPIPLVPPVITMTWSSSRFNLIPIMAPLGPGTCTICLLQDAAGETRTQE
jgi:hypothetical protein